MEQIKISIIISVYNTEKYLSTCLDSIISQTYQNLEIIVIDDGSSDKSFEALKEYQKKDQRMKVFQNDQNSGLSYSRNKGVKHATGEYISFIDSDDYVDSDYYEKLVSHVYQDQADIVVANIKSIYENTGAVLVSLGCNGREDDKLSYIHTGLSASACNKLIHRDLLRSYSFPEGFVNEDLPVIIPCIVESKKISYEPNVNYYYIQRDHSIQNSHFSEKRFHIFEMLSLTFDRIKYCNNYEQIRESLIFYQIILLLFYEFVKIPTFLKRIDYLRKYAKLSKEYDLLSNQYLSSFFQKTGAKTGYFYHMLLWLVVHHHLWSASFLISFYQFYKKHFGMISLPNYNLDDLASLAEKNSKRKEVYPQVSVVIPNYNYEKFLYQRVGSILSQKVKIHEIIFLDDCSSDDSRKVIDSIADNISSYISVKKDYNKINSGSAFCQWEKGFSLATGDYVWICEADDYCNEKLLKCLIKPIEKNKNVVISYCNTAMIDTVGNLVVSSLTKEIDQQNSGHWNCDYVINGEEEIKKYAYLNCTIANVSSALIKRSNYSEYFQLAKQFKQAGDWVLYLLVMSEGDVAFSKEVCNYYRIHGNNVTSVTKKQAHYEEIQKVHKLIREKFSLDSSQEEKIQKRYEYLKEVWNLDRKKEN